MAMDLEAIKKRLANLTDTKKKTQRWKPTDVHNVRCLPLPGDEDISFVVKWHYGVDAGKQIACPSTWGEDGCEFCELGKKLKSWRNEDGSEKPESVRKKDWEFFKKIDAAVKHYIPVIVRKDGTDEVEGPFLWELTPNTYKTVLKILVDDDYNADHPEGGGLKILTSTKHGRDLVVELKKKGEKGNQTSYDLTDVSERKRTTPTIKGSAEDIKALLAKIPSIDDIAKQVTVADIAKVFKAWSGELNKQPVQEDSASGDVEYGGKSAEKVATSGLDVDAVTAKLEQLAGSR